MEMAKVKYVAYVGTYTSGKSEGIYTFNLNTETGSLEKTGEPIKIDNPSYLALDKDRKYLYAALENGSFNGEYGGGVAACSIEKGTGKLKLLNSQPTKGMWPCHLCTDSINKHLFVANYKEGTLTVFPVNEDGSINSLSSIISHSGSGPNKERQEKAHVHYVILTPNEEYLCAIDLGIDSIMLYKFDQEQETLTSAKDLTVNIKSGSGPRHMEFHKDKKHAYLVNELSSEVAVLKYSPSDSSFEVIQYISTLPEGFDGISTCAAIHISPDGNFLYASNRGDDSIAIFSIDKTTGMLKFITTTSTKGECPRDFRIDPSGKFLFVANQDSNTIVPFEINPSTGLLTPLDSIVSIEKPVCIIFNVLEG